MYSWLGPRVPPGGWIVVAIIVVTISFAGGAGRKTPQSDSGSPRAAKYPLRPPPVHENPRPPRELPKPFQHSINGNSNKIQYILRHRTGPGCRLGSASPDYD